MATEPQHSAGVIIFHRVQEIDIERVHSIGNNGTGQTGITLDGTGNYSGGTFQSFPFPTSAPRSS